MGSSIERDLIVLALVGLHTLSLRSIAKLDVSKCLQHPPVCSLEARFFWKAARVSTSSGNDRRRS